MDAEQIVRTLAAIPADDLECYGECGCTFCGEFGPDDHDRSCLWRLAREWVTANPAVPTFHSDRLGAVTIPEE